MLYQGRRVLSVIVDYGDTLSHGRYFRSAPPGCDDWTEVVEDTVFRTSYFDSWMEGSITCRDAAELIGRHVSLSAEEALHYMREGCRGLPLNQRVLDFVRGCRSSRIATALVTCNVDLFNEVVVPDQCLGRLFDVIVNSFDHRTCDKTRLWPVAFDKLGTQHGYATSFCLDDSPRNVDSFRALGGIAHRYTDDNAFNAWLRTVPFQPSESVTENLA